MAQTATQPKIYFGTLVRIAHQNGRTQIDIQNRVGLHQKELDLHVEIPTGIYIRIVEERKTHKILELAAWYHRLKSKGKIFYRAQAKNEKPTSWIPEGLSLFPCLHPTATLDDILDAVDHYIREIGIRSLVERPYTSLDEFIGFVGKAPEYHTNVEECPHCREALENGVNYVLGQFTHGRMRSLYAVARFL